MGLIIGFFGLLVEIALLITFLHAVILGLLRLFGPEIPRERLTSRFWGWIGFFWVKHRTALTVFRNGKFIRILPAPDGHRWYHVWPHLHRDRIGPDFELAPNFAPYTYENIPTSLGPSLLEQLGGNRNLFLPPRAGRPVNITIKMIAGYIFKPQDGTVMDAVEKAIYRTPSERSQAVCALLRPELERITGLLNPIDIKLRVADDLIKDQLKERMAENLQRLGYELLSLEIESITLPESLEIAFVANQELMRQSISHYNADELARMLAVQLGQGMRSSAEVVTTAGLDTALGRALNLSPPKPGGRKPQG